MSGDSDADPRATDSTGSQGFTVLICTCDRPDQIARIVASLLVPIEDPVEVLVVDQSDGDETALALDQLRASAGPTQSIRYVHTPIRGKGAAMNLGLELASTDVVVCTDDDTEAAPGWVRSMSELLSAHPAAAVGFCRVEAPPHDQAVGYVPAYHPSRERILTRPLVSSAHRGLGAGMVVRRSAIATLGGVDASFGPGARFRSGDDWDLEVRMLMSGHRVVETDRIAILHHGFRTYAEGAAHTERDWIALGAVAAKPVRAGHPALLLMAVYVLVADALLPMAVDVAHLRRPRGLRRVMAFLRGFAQGIGTPVDRATLRYRVVDQPGR